MGLILSINCGIGSSVGVFAENGVPIICIEEERFNRIKNSFGFPEKALSYLIDKKIVSNEIVEKVLFTNSENGIASKKAFYEYYDASFATALKNSKNETGKYFNNLLTKIRDTRLYEIYCGIRYGKAGNGSEEINKILKNFGLDTNKVLCVEHHLCHAASAYYGLARNKEDKYLVFTLDGGGDGLTSTVSKGYNSKLERQSSSDCYSIGNMYSAVTYFLGFTPHEHEYKLMGLAPYVNPKYVEKYKPFFAQFLKLKEDDTVFYNPIKLNHAKFFECLVDQFPKDRFDNISAGLQAFTEEIVCKWVKGNIKKYGINKVLCGGGVFMNVKLNKLLSELPEVEYIDVFPSCGDESNIFGAAFYTFSTTKQWSKGLLERYTLGTKPIDIETSIEKYYNKIVAKKIENANKYIAEQLAAGKIVARCSGAMEFGARALGNRSILADPRNLSSVNRINQMVKKRDFWMPFAPAMLAEKADTLIDIPDSLKQQQSPFMMFAFNAKENKRNVIPCGLHQADFTARAETVSESKYPDMHEIISNFDNLTGVPCILNTSFNLHGYPIVENADQAIDVLLNSEIDVLIVENYCLKRA